MKLLIGFIVAALIWGILALTLVKPQPPRKSGLLDLIWNKANATAIAGPREHYTTPRYRTSGTPTVVGKHADWNPIPYCWNCHRGQPLVYGGYTIAWPDGSHLLVGK